MTQQPTHRDRLKVLVPIYKEHLSPLECRVLRHTADLLRGHTLVFLKPQGLICDDVSPYLSQFETVEVSPEWLGTKNGIAGYNRMMLSEDFYRIFDDTTYILIHHLDAWMFRDELQDWCDRGYDLVAAPWPLRPRYTRFPLKQWLKLKECLATSRHQLSRTQMYGRIGNGGLCLRRVEAFAQACRKYADEAAYFLSHPGEGMYNEDIFWALVPQELRCPSVTEALQFAFDLKPRLCYDLNHHRLPMGCHGFMHKSREQFWKQFIDF